MALKDDDRSPNSSLRGDRNRHTQLAAATRWTAAARLFTGLVRMRLNSSDNRLTTRHDGRGGQRDVAGERGDRGQRLGLVDLGDDDPVQARKFQRRIGRQRLGAQIALAP